MKRLYKRVCLFVGWSVGLPISPFVDPSVASYFFLSPPPLALSTSLLVLTIHDIAASLIRDALLHNYTRVSHSVCPSFGPIVTLLNVTREINIFELVGARGAFVRLRQKQGWIHSFESHLEGGNAKASQTN